MKLSLNRMGVRASDLVIKPGPNNKSAKVDFNPAEPAVSLGETDPKLLKLHTRPPIKIEE
jgi:hypothetical protein